MAINNFTNCLGYIVLTKNCVAQLPAWLLSKKLIAYLYWFNNHVNTYATVSIRMKLWQNS